MFTKSFNKYACIGDTIETELNGFTVTARIEHDPDYSIDDDDCHNTDQSVTGCDDEQFARLLDARKAYFNDDWHYCGVVLSISKNGILLDNHAASTWGIELNYPNHSDEYLTQVANELLDDAIERGKYCVNLVCAA